MKFLPICLLLPLCLIFASCTAFDRGSQPWEPIYGGPNTPIPRTPAEADDPAHPPDWRTLRAQAYTARTLREARDSLEAYLANPESYAGAIGELEDGPHYYGIAGARYELVRIYWLLGEEERGDLLFRGLDPLDLIADETSPGFNFREFEEVALPEGS
jgi:hypothetical protein